MSQSYLRDGPRDYECFIDLTELNYAEFEDDVYNKIGLYGLEVASEIRTGTMVVLRHKLPRPTYDYHVELPDGSIVTTTYPWNDAQDTKLAAENQAIDLSNKEIALSRAKCWVRMMAAITEPIRVALMDNFSESFCEARESNNVAALMRLLKQTCERLATDVVEQLRAELVEISHDHPHEHIDDYIERLLRLFEKLENAGEILTDADIVHKLTTSVNVEFWRPMITDAYVNAKGHPAYPQWLEITRRMSFLWNNYRHATVSDNGIPSPRSESENSSMSASTQTKSKRKRKRSRKGKNKDTARAAKARQVSEKESARTKKVFTADLKKKEKDKGVLAEAKRAVMANTVCYKCANKGHYATQCDSPDPKCNNCSSDRHMTQFCAVAANSKALRVNTDKMRHNMMSLKVDVGAEGDRMITVESSVEPDSFSIPLTDPTAVDQNMGDHLSVEDRLLSGLIASRDEPESKTLRVFLLRLRGGQENDEEEGDDDGSNDAATSLNTTTADAVGEISEGEADATITTSAESSTEVGLTSACAEQIVQSTAGTGMDGKSAAPTAVGNAQIFESAENKPLESGEVSPEINQAAATATLVNTFSPIPAANIINSSLTGPIFLSEEDSGSGKASALGRCSDVGWEKIHSLTIKRFLEGYDYYGRGLQYLAFKKQIGYVDGMVHYLTKYSKASLMDQIGRETRKSSKFRGLSDQEKIDLLMEDAQKKFCVIAEQYCSYMGPEGFNDDDGFKTSQLVTQIQRIPLSMRCDHYGPAETVSSGPSTCSSRQVSDNEEELPPATRSSMKRSAGDNGKSGAGDRSPQESSKAKKRPKVEEQIAAGLPRSRPTREEQGILDFELFGLVFNRGLGQGGFSILDDAELFRGTFGRKFGEAPGPENDAGQRPRAEVTAPVEGSGKANAGKVIPSKKTAEAAPRAGGKSSENAMDLVSSSDEDESSDKLPPPPPPKKKPVTAKAAAAGSANNSKKSAAVAATVVALASGSLSKKPSVMKPVSQQKVVAASRPVVPTPVAPPPGSVAATPVATAPTTVAQTRPVIDIRTMRVSVTRISELGLKPSQLTMQDGTKVRALRRLDNAEISNAEWREMTPDLMDAEKDDVLIEIAIRSYDALQYQQEETNCVYRRVPSSLAVNMVGVKHKKASVKKAHAKKRKDRRVIVDSGATVNVAGTKGCFGTIKPRDHSYVMESASHQDMAIDVFGHVPGVGMTVESKDIDDDILSVYQLTEEVPGLAVMFTRGQMLITHPYLNEPIIGAITNNNLFTLEDSDVTLLLNARSDAKQLCSARPREEPTDVGVPPTSEEPTAVGVPPRQADAVPIPVATGERQVDPALVASEAAEPVSDVPECVTPPASGQKTGEITERGLNPRR